VKRWVTVLLAAAAMAAAPSRLSAAVIVVYGGHADDELLPGASLTDVRMTVALSVSAGLGIMTFTNTSVAPETTAVFKEIVVDMYDADRGPAGAVLWDPLVLTNTSEVAFTAGASNGLPGYHDVTSETPPLLELQAKKPPPRKGLGPGEMLQVQFDTSLPDGSDIMDYLDFFDGGEDGRLYTVGFHAISATVVEGGSLSGIYTPEPGTLVLILLGAVGGLLRRR